MLDPDPDRRASKLAPLLKRLDQADRSSSSRSERAPNARAERERREAQEAAWNGDAERWAHDARRWGRAERERVRDEFRKNRAERRRTEKQERRDRRAGRRQRPLHGPPLVLAVLGLNVAIMVVWMMLGIVVPTVLVILSILFGRPLRDAARATRLAGEDARKSMTRAMHYLLHGPHEPDDATHQARPRVEEEPPPKARVRVDAEGEVVDTTAEPVDSSDERRAQR